MEREMKRREAAVCELKQSKIVISAQTLNTWRALWRAHGEVMQRTRASVTNAERYSQKVGKSKRARHTQKEREREREREGDIG